MFRPEENSPPANSTPGGKRNLNAPPHPSLLALGGGYSYTFNCAGGLFHPSGEGRAPTVVITTSLTTGDPQLDTAHLSGNTTDALECRPLS